MFNRIPFISANSRYHIYIDCGWLWRKAHKISNLIGFDNIGLHTFNCCLLVNTLELVVSESTEQAEKYEQIINMFTAEIYGTPIGQHFNDLECASNFCVLNFVSEIPLRAVDAWIHCCTCPRWYFINIKFYIIN